MVRGRFGDEAHLGDAGALAGHHQAAHALVARVLVKELKKESIKDPQPEVHIRGDQDARYESVGRLVVACQRAGIAKVGFIIEPPPNP